MITKLIYSTRTVRRFREGQPLTHALLTDLVDLARVGGSARNAQVLKYMIITDRGLRQALFPLLGWAGYLSDWPGPVPGERPPAYIICLQEKNLVKGAEAEVYCDLGIATQNMLLGAAQQGIFGCRIGAFSPQVHQVLGLDDRYTVLLVLALGYPAETVILEEMGADQDVRYWRDGEGVHHVPKRRLAEVMVAPPESA